MHETEHEKQFEEEIEMTQHDVQMTIMVTLLRIYDVLAAEAIERNPEGAVAHVLKMHEKGLINGAPPALRNE